jgi:CHAT domain-containing protein
MRGDNAQALFNYRRSLQALGNSEATVNAILLNNIAMIYRVQGEYAQALDYATLGAVNADQDRLTESLDDYRKSLTLYQQVGNKRDTAYTLGAMGEVLIRQARYAEARKDLEQALDLSTKAGLKAMIAQSETALAQLSYSQGRFKEALQLADRSSQLINQTEYRSALWPARTVAGRAWVALRDKRQAREAFDEAISNIEELRTHVAGAQESRAGFFQNTMAPYHAMIEMLIAQHHPGAALHYAERAKARALLDTLTAAHPYTAPPKALLASELTHLLPNDDTVALEFVVCEARTYLFVIGLDKVTTYTINITAKDLQKETESFRQQLANRDLAIKSSAARLYKQFLSPALSQLNGHPSTLIIVPDGPLWNLPFQALSGNPSDSSYVIETHAVAYVPSLTVLREMIELHARHRSSVPTPSQHELLIFADPDLSITGSAASTPPAASATYTSAALPSSPLPETRHEAHALKSLYDATTPTNATVLRIGPEARESLFKAEASAYRILHLATHGVLDDANPMYSNIVLTPDPAGGKEDGFLQAREIMQMTLHADLAVLSACDTARGRITYGEGVTGLAWSFFVAGVPTTVVSQWSVESASSAQLMLEFHRNLRLSASSASSVSGLPATTAKALQHAQLKMLHSPQYAHPFYWAGFVTIGDPG